MKDEPLEDLECVLRDRAFAFDAELVVDTMSDGRLRAAFKQLAGSARSGEKARHDYSLLLAAHGFGRA